MKTLLFKKLNNDKLIEAALQLSTSGYLAVTSKNLTYLDIDDQYIHQLFPLLEDKTIKKPDYFGQNSIGAHISVIYPEENTSIDQVDLGIQHHFTINGIYTAELGLKSYYALIIESASLSQLRKKYGLPRLLCLKNFRVEPHITVGVRLNRSDKAFHDHY